LNAVKNLLISCHNGNIAGRSSGFRLGQWVRFQPKSSRGRKRIDCTLLPPRAFLSAAMNLTVMRPAQRHREFIAYLATECTGLHKTQMMRIRRTPTSNQAGFFDDMSLQTKFSMRCALLYISLSKWRGVLRLLLGGITGVLPAARNGSMTRSSASKA
jgi:hypothetical protein